MSDVIVNQFLEIKTYCHLDNQLGINVHYGQIQIIGAGGIGITDLTSDISTWFATSMKALLCTPALYLGVSVRQYDNGGGNNIPYWSKTGQGYGSAGATPCPKQCAGILTKTTLDGSRAGRGRLYIPFPATADVEADGNPTAGYLTRAIALAAAIDGDENVSSDPEVVLRFGLMHWRVASSFIRTNDVIARDRFATQRRRGDYGRINAIPSQLL